MPPTFSPFSCGWSGRSTPVPLLLTLLLTAALWNKYFFQKRTPRIVSLESLMELQELKAKLETWCQICRKGCSVYQELMAQRFTNNRTELFPVRRLICQGKSFIILSFFGWHVFIQNRNGSFLFSYQYNRTNTSLTLPQYAADVVGHLKRFRKPASINTSCG